MTFTRSPVGLAYRVSNNKRTLMFTVYLMKNGWLVSTERFNNSDDAFSFATRYVKGKARNSAHIVWNDTIGRNVLTF